MDSDGDDGFPKQGGEALEIGDEFDSEEEDGEDMPSAATDAMRQPLKANIAASSGPAGAAGAKAAEVKGKQVEDQPFDLAVDVNDSEEIDSDEEEDEVNMDVQ